MLASPPLAFERAVLIGKQKARRSPSVAFALATLSGAHVAMGACIALVIGNAPGLKDSDPGLQRLAFGAVGLPLALLMTVVTGSELATANFAFVTMAALERATSCKRLFKSLGVALAGNTVGALLVVWLARSGGLLEGRQDVLALAEYKAAAPPGELVSKAILCNWLVCMGAYMASIAADFGGKAIAIWLPITSFAALGLEHTVANIFFLGAGGFQSERIVQGRADCPLTPCPLDAGWAHGADLTFVGVLWGNLVWVILGNYLGALFGLVLPFSFAYGTLGDEEPPPKSAAAVNAEERHVVNRLNVDDDAYQCASRTGETPQTAQHPRRGGSLAVSPGGRPCQYY